MQNEETDIGAKNATLQKRVAVITGAGSGIGKELAMQLAEEGCDLALADISQPGLDNIQRELRDVLVDGCPIKTTCHVVDVADLKQMQLFAEAVAKEHGGVNYVFNNAGVALGARIDAANYEDMHWIMNINYWGVVHGCTVFLPLLKQQETAHIINVSSVFGLFTAPYNGIYSASKFAVNAFTDALAQELKGTSVNVSCAFPAGIKTDIAKSARIIDDPANNQSAEELEQTIEKLFWTSASQAASEILRGTAKQKQRILVGKGATLMDIVRRLFPVGYARILKL